MDELQELAHRFPRETLSILEGGCGYGEILRQLARDATQPGLAISSLLLPESVHFVVDVRGAFFYDIPRARNKPIGTTVLPIYAEILKVGGEALLFEWGFKQDSGWLIRTIEERKIIVQQLLTLIADNGLNVVRRMGPYTLLRK